MQPLHKLFYQIWNEEKFHQDWQNAVLLPFFKKGDKTLCSNYQAISLIDVAAKVFAVILHKRLQPHRDTRTRHNQAGFRTSRGCLDQLFSLRRILEHRFCYQQPTVVCFIDFTAAFDSIDHESLTFDGSGWRTATNHQSSKSLLQRNKSMCPGVR